MNSTRFAIPRWHKLTTVQQPPRCYNRAAFCNTAVVRDGYTTDGRLITKTIPDPMSKGCQQWGELGEARLKNWNCDGCKWKP